MNNKLSSKVNKFSEQLSGQQLKFIVFTVLVCFYGYRNNNKGLSYNLKMNGVIELNCCFLFVMTFL